MSIIEVSPGLLTLSKTSPQLSLVLGKPSFRTALQQCFPPNSYSPISQGIPTPDSTTRHTLRLDILTRYINLPQWFILCEIMDLWSGHPLGIGPLHAAKGKIRWSFLAAHHRCTRASPNLSRPHLVSSPPSGHRKHSPMRTWYVVSGANPHNGSKRLSPTRARLAT